MKAARQPETGNQGSVPLPDATAQKKRSRAPGEHPTPHQAPRHRFRKRNAKGEPDLYPREQDAQACGLFI